MSSEDSLIGRTLAGRYRIKRCIGKGGMATVFAAEQDRDPKHVAVKVMKRELMRDATVVKRFRREAKAASMLDHPNTVRVIDYGVDGQDAFIAMELARGQDLFQALAEERPMGQARAAYILAQVCSALAAAHAQGIIHRDLKPENVMLIPSSDAPGGALIKVLDFGIAKILEDPNAPKEQAEGSRSETNTNLTRVGTVVGTPAYMSPEQCRGGELDARSDVYSSGVLLYQLVTGQLPFLGETPLHTAMRHIHAPPRPPRELRPDLDERLERTVLKALAKWPNERHQSAKALRQEILTYVQDLPDHDTLATSSLGGSEAPDPMGREQTEHQLGMRLGGGLGRLAGSARKAVPDAPPAPTPRDARTDTPTDKELPLAGPASRGRSARVESDGTPTANPAVPATAQRRWAADDDEPTNLRPLPGASAPAGPERDAQAKAASDDDDEPRTHVISPSVPAPPMPEEPREPPRRRDRPDARTLLMEEPRPKSAVAPTAQASSQHAGPSPSATNAPSIPPESGLSSLKSTMRITDDLSNSSAGVPSPVSAVESVVHPPLRPQRDEPQAAQAPAEPAPASTAFLDEPLAADPAPAKSVLEQLPRSAVLVMGVGVGVVVSAVIVLLLLLVLQR